jgi:hypothetical protein
MNRLSYNFKKFLIIIPIYCIYILVFELALGYSFGDIWDDLLTKFGIIKATKKHKLV